MCFLLDIFGNQNTNMVIHENEVFFLLLKPVATVLNEFARFNFNDSLEKTLTHLIGINSNMRLSISS